jgi:predicted secreted protein
MTVLEKSVKEDVKMMVSNLVRRIGETYSDLNDDTYKLIDIVNIKGSNYCIVELIVGRGGDKYQLKPVRYVYGNLNN